MSAMEAQVYTFTNRRQEVLGRTERAMTRDEVQGLLERFGLRASVRKNGVDVPLRDRDRVADLPFVTA